MFRFLCVSIANLFCLLVWREGNKNSRDRGVCFSSTSVHIINWTSWIGSCIWKYEINELWDKPSLSWVCKICLWLCQWWAPQSCQREGGIRCFSSKMLSLLSLTFSGIPIILLVKWYCLNGTCFALLTNLVWTLYCFHCSMILLESCDL